MELSQILAKAEGKETLSQRELGNILSRTFGPDIDLLMFAKGRSESNDKFRYVTNLNNNARFADCIEDGMLERGDKLDALRRLTFIHNNIDSADIDVEELINTKLNCLVADVIKLALNKNEKIYIGQFGIGNTLRELRRFKPSVKKAIVSSMNKMTNGMSVYIAKGKLETIKELKNYCFFVAGTVGDALNDIVRIEDRENLKHNNARSIAAYFQLTNIIKNLREDFELRDYRVKFIPDEIHDGISYEDLLNGDTKYAMSMREKALDELLSVSQDYFLPATQYVIDIPRRLSGYLAFCAVPLVLSRENQKLIRKSGAERVFGGEESAIKVGKDVLRNVLKFVYRSVQSDEGIKFIHWLNEYRKNPDQFPFETWEYEGWSKEWIRSNVVLL